MIGICPSCGDHEWNKVVSGSCIRCPQCGHTWSFKKLPMFVLTGCSGVGKTTAAQELMQRDINFVVLDSDIFYGIMPLETEEDFANRIEYMQSFSKNIMQSGKPVLWTMAGNLDRLNGTYNRRFFSDIFCLALVCDEKELHRRMTEGRNISDENWLKGSADYNNYFKTHNSIGNTMFDTYDTTGKSVSEIADHIIEWVSTRSEGECGSSRT